VSELYLGVTSEKLVVGHYPGPDSFSGFHVYAIFTVVRAPMRALIIPREYPPAIEGGLARHVRKLSENLVRHDVDVHVLQLLEGPVPGAVAGAARVDQGPVDVEQDRLGLIWHGARGSA